MHAGLTSCPRKKEGKAGWQGGPLPRARSRGGPQRDLDSLSAECLFRCGVYEKVMRLACFAFIVTKMSRDRENRVGGVEMPKEAFSFNLLVRRSEPKSETAFQLVCQLYELEFDVYMLSIT